MPERPVPHNLDAERAVLGAIVLDNSKFPTVAQNLRSSADFFLPQNAIIYRRLSLLIEGNKVADLVTLTDALSQHGELEQAGGAAYLASLLDGIPHISHVDSYAQIVAEKSYLRRLAHAGQKLAAQALDQGASPALLRAEVEALLKSQTGGKPSGNGKGRFSYLLMDFLKETFPVPDHLVEGLIPRSGSVMIYALPHRLKSWFTTALALQASKPGLAFGRFEVKDPIRTLLVQVEDLPGQLQWRLRQLLQCAMFSSCDPANVAIVPRCELNLLDEATFQKILHEAREFRADLIIFDVVRRIFRGDINSPKESAQFVEQLDRLRESSAVALVHHANKKDAELMTGFAGSYNLGTWANVIIEFRRKIVDGSVTHVEMEVENKLAESPAPVKMILDLGSEQPIRMEAVEDIVGVMDAKDRLADEWTIRDLSEVLEVHKSNAARRLKKWIATGTVEKISGGKRGRSGGLARYKFTGE